MLATLRTFNTLSNYGVSIIPCARRETRRWAAAAAAIPDPILRGHATDAIAVDASNAEAVAALAATAPRRQRRKTVKLLVAYQILVDYVDTVGERICAHELRRGLEIGMALAAAIDTPASPLRLDPLGDDGGYLVALVAACRGRLWQLPSAAIVEQQAASAAARCAQALAHSHTAAQLGTTDGLRQWTAAQPATAGYSWWEIAAGGNSSIAILALLAAAADPATTRFDAAAVAAAYWPDVCVMSTMLDSLVDYERDAITGDFSFVSHYPGPAAVRCGLIRATTRSLAATKPLRSSHTHTMIVCGVAGYYAASATHGSLAAQLAPSLVAALGPTATPIILALRAQHRLGATREGRAARRRRGRRSPAGAGPRGRAGHGRR
jgi:tetraprenyl-beta-curcumene synthase